jgi:LacI family transcriptional regulator
MDEIAAQAGVCKTVVSEVLRNVPGRRYSEATRKRVLEIAEKLNYRPNFFASQIRAPFRRLAALGVDALDDPFAGAIADAFRDEMASRNYHVVVFSPKSSGGANFLNDAVGKHGILLLSVVGYGSRESLPDAELLRIVRDGVKVVTIGRPAPGPEVSEVTYDNEGGVRQMIDGVIRPDMKRIWLLGRAGPEREETSADIAGLRCQWAEKYLRAKKWADKVWVMRTERAESNFIFGQQCVERALAGGDKPDAVLCFADQVALGAIRAFYAAGLEVGRDVAVCGFNDQPMSAFMRPSLSSVRIPVHEMGRRAGQVMADLSEGRLKSAARICLSTTFMERESSRWRKRGG